MSECKFCKLEKDKYAKGYDVSQEGRVGMTCRGDFEVCRQTHVDNRMVLEYVYEEERTSLEDCIEIKYCPMCGRKLVD